MANETTQIGNIDSMINEQLIFIAEANAHISYHNSKLSTALKNIEILTKKKIELNTQTNVKEENQKDQ